MSMGMPATVEERDADKRKRGAKEVLFTSKMYFYGRKICFILVLLASNILSYALLQKVSPRTAKGPSPTPFFTRSSLVADFYHGQLSPAFARVSESDVSFVMYYAPWDAESQATRSQYKIVAQQYYKQVYFAAINCWHPGSECRQQFSKVQHFPVLIVYTQHNKGVQYKGVKDAPHMMRFLQSVLRPLNRIREPIDLVELMTAHDAVVVGFFDFKGNLGGQGYHTYYMASLKFLERDPYREIGFAVVTDSATASRDFGVVHFPTVRIYLWNETLEFQANQQYDADSLVRWTWANIHQVTQWISPPGVKSLTLAPYLETGPVLVLFTPRNPLQNKNYYYSMLREVSLDYFNCDGNPWVDDLIRHLAKQRTEAKRHHLELEKICMERQQRHLAMESSPPVQLSVVTGGQWINKTAGCCPSRRRIRKFECSESGCYDEMQHEYCSAQIQHNVQRYLRPKVETSMLAGKGDEKSAEALTEAYEQEKCKRLHRAKLVHPIVFPYAASHRRAPRDFSGLACHTNRTMAFIAMDSLQFHEFAEGLGIDVMTYPDRTVAVVVSALQESSFVMDSEHLSHSSLMELIHNYTVGILSRSLRSSSVEPKTLLECEGVCVQELTSSSFSSVVMDPYKDVVILYHTPYCAFCHSISHIYLTVAWYFRAVHNLTFTRINGESNDLSWEFTVDYYPSILFFPAHRKSESRVFPQNRAVTVPNLLDFVLTNLGSRIRGLLGLCAAWGEARGTDSARNCVQQLRRTILESMAEMLRQYRLTKLHHQRNPRPQLARTLRHMLRKLCHLREIHLLLGATDRLHLASEEFNTIQKILKEYLSLSSVSIRQL